MTKVFIIDGIQGVFDENKNILSVGKFKVVVKKYLAKNFIPSIWDKFYSSCFHLEVYDTYALLRYDPDVGIGFEQKIGSRVGKVKWDASHDWMLRGK